MPTAIVEKTGNLFDHPGKAIGHSVNCQGEMGAGIAAEMRRRFPEMYWQYRERCRLRFLEPGEVYIHWRDPLASPHAVVNLAGQRLPGADARIEWITSALTTASIELSWRNVDTLAIPRIGCGIGGLSWGDVRQAIGELNLQLKVVVYSLEDG